MQSPGEEGSFSQDEKDTKSQEEPEKAGGGATAPSAQEVGGVMKTAPLFTSSL